VVLIGIAGSPGLEIGPAIVVDTRRTGVVHRRIPKHKADEEIGRYDEAVRAAARELREVVERLKASVAKSESSILEAYVLMVEDESLREDVERRIRIDLQCVEWALDVAVQEMADQLGAASDPYLAERSHDFQFIGDRILRALSGKQRALSIPEVEDASILVAHDLSPAETAGLSRDRIKALVTEVGTRTSHTAILARALEIPAVVGVRDILSRVGNGDTIIVDGLRGRVTVAPSRPMIDAAAIRAERHLAHARGLRELNDRPAATKCGVPIQIRANIELPAEAHIAIGQGAQGIGLYRTEFLYVDRTEPPSEAEQYEVYRAVLESVRPLPVTLRTFDIGGDKFVTTFQAPPEMNPALGLRAVRLGLSRPEIFLDQLRAMVRASAHGDMRIMVPMIASVHELQAVRELLAQAAREVDRAGHERKKHIPLGIMVEVPAAAIMADELAVYAEFLSIGTNDLVQYTLAVDRSSQDLAYLASPFDPAILRLIGNVVRAGKHHDRPVSVCGAMASDPLAAVLLVGMGLREISMEASAIPVVKEAIGRVSLAEAEHLAERAREGVTADEVEQAVAGVFAPLFADLLDNDLD
jgi:phosphoenolpyruvate-protein phosphotransferase (PTS system enzyme I)